MSHSELPLFTAMGDVQHAIAQMDNQMPGPWWVWGDDKEPFLTDVDYATMKAYVDKAHLEGRDEIYGEDVNTNKFYEGEE